VAPEELRTFIERHGKEVAKQHRDASELGSDHGLPNCHEASEAAQGASEIDALVLAGMQREASRRYRQLTRTTWDQAFKTVGGWHDLERSKKLALLGWCPKDKPQVGESAMLNHPLRDRLLDG
jgi:hypothetical protein